MDAIEEQFKFKPSRSPSVPGVGLCGKKLSVESHRQRPVGWLLERQAGEADVPHCWPCTIPSSRQCWCTAQCLEANPVSSIGVLAAHWIAARQRLRGSLPNLATAQIYTATVFCKVFTTLSFFPPSSDLMRELRSQG